MNKEKIRIKIILRTILGISFFSLLAILILFLMIEKVILIIVIFIVLFVGLIELNIIKKGEKKMSENGK